MSMKDKKLFLLDMDGTLYLGMDLFPEAVPFLNAIRENGAEYLFLTNNSSRNAVKYVEKMRKLGIETKVEEYITSVQATVRYLKRNYSERLIYVEGTRAFFEELQNSGLHVTTEATEDVNLVVVGYDTELTYQKLDDCSRLLTKDIPFLAANPDWVCPTAYGYVPDCGSVCEMLTRATGKKPRFIGKPEPDMVYMAMEKMGCAKKDCVLVGDRLYTDIKAALNAGIDGAFVLSGEGTLKDIEETGVKPTYIYNGVGDITKEILG